MRLREWRDVAPRKECMGPKVLSVIDEAIALLGAEPNPDCWVAWGDDPTVRYTVLAPIDAGLLAINVRVNVPGEGPRAQGKLVRWNRVQTGELAVEIQGGHRLLNFQIEGLVLRGSDAEAEILSEFVLIVYDGMDGRSSVILAGSAPSAGGPIVTPVRRKPPTVPRPARPEGSRPLIDVVIFDLDGVIVDSEVWWDEVRSAFAADHGRTWSKADQAAVMGANSRGWSRIMRERLELDMADTDIEQAIVDGVVARFARDGAPQIDGAVEAVRRIAARRPVAIASSAHRRVIDAALDATGLAETFAVVLSSDDVAHGKPAPDVYLEVARRLGADPARALVVEDSRNGVLAGKAAGMTVVLVPNESVPPAPGTAEAADLVIARLAELDPDAIAA